MRITRNSTYSSPSRPAAIKALLYHYYLPLLLIAELQFSVSLFVLTKPKNYVENINGTQNNLMTQKFMLYIFAIVTLARI